MGFCKTYLINCNLYPCTNIPFTVDFVRDKNDKIVVMPINVCDQSNNSEICFKCVNKLWHTLMETPNLTLPESYDFLNP